MAFGRAEDNFCHKCDKKLNKKKIEWLELSNTDNRFYKKIPNKHISQGFFPFGKDCAKKMTTTKI